jgi:hypothetical protein
MVGSHSGSSLCDITCASSHASHLGSVADPNHFDADTDPTSKKLDADPDPIMLHIKIVTRYFCFNMAYKTYLLTEKFE